MGWLGDLWRWALDHGSLVPHGIAALVTLTTVMLAATALVWALAALKWIGQRFMEGYRRNR